MPTGLEQHLVDQLEAGEQLFWHRLRWRAVAACLPRGRPFSLVDVGAGSGLLARFLAREFPSATYRFVEPLAGLRSVLRERHGLEADLGEQGPFTGSEVVTLLDVLEHQDDDRAFLAGLVGRMDEGATLLLTVPALPLLWSAWDEGLGHRRRYTRSSLRSVLAGVPLEVDEVTYLFPAMLGPGLMRSLTSRRGAASEGAELAMPRLPFPVDDLLYGVGRVGLALRRFNWLGTSLLVVARKRSAAAGRGAAVPGAPRAG